MSGTTRRGVRAGAAAIVVAVVGAGAGAAVLGARDSVREAPTAPIAPTAAAPTAPAAPAAPASPTAQAAPAPSTSDASDATRASGSSDAASGVAAARTRTAFTVVLNGDILLHPALWRTAAADGKRSGTRPYDFRPLVGAMRPLVSGADLAICHLETPVGKPGGPFRGYPSFTVPPQILPALKWAGYDACTTASNHTIDDSFTGLVRTTRALDAAGLAHTGSWATAQQARRPLIMTVKGVRVAVVSGTYGLNGLRLPRDKTWAVGTIDPARLIGEATRARAAGADVVLAALHWGQEYRTAPTAQQKSIATALSRSGQFDLVYGHHAHVVQPFQRVGSTWVLYGLGNAVAHQAAKRSGTYEGVTARVTFAPLSGSPRWKVSALEYVPTVILRESAGRPVRVAPVSAALADPRLARGQQARLKAARANVVKVVTSLGAVREGAREGR